MLSELNCLLVATPVIAASNSANKYEIAGVSVTLTCTSISDNSGAGSYIWKQDGSTKYVSHGIYMCIYDNIMYYNPNL